MRNPGATNLLKNLHFVLSCSAKLLLDLAFGGAGDGDRTRDVQLGKLAFYR